MPSINRLSVHLPASRRSSELKPTRGMASWPFSRQIRNFSAATQSESHRSPDNLDFANQAQLRQCRNAIVRCPIRSGGQAKVLHVLPRCLIRRGPTLDRVEPACVRRPIGNPTTHHRFESRDDKGSPQQCCWPHRRRQRRELLLATRCGARSQSSSRSCPPVLRAKPARLAVETPCREHLAAGDTHIAAMDRTKECHAQSRQCSRVPRNAAQSARPVRGVIVLPARTQACSSPVPQTYGRLQWIQRN